MERIREILTVLGGIAGLLMTVYAVAWIILTEPSHRVITIDSSQVGFFLVFVLPVLAAAWSCDRRK